MGSKFNPLVFILILLIVIITSYFILLPKIKQSSYRLTVILSLLLFTEMVRYLTSSLLTYQFIYIDMEFLWIAILPLVIKTLSTFLIVEVNDKLLLGNDLQKCVDYIRPSDFLSNTFMEHPDAVVLTDIDLNIVLVNPKALENTGYRKEEVLGKQPKIFARDFTNPNIYLDLKASLKPIYLGKVNLLIKEEC